MTTTFGNMPGGAGPTPQGGGGHVYNNTGDHVPNGGLVMNDLSGAGLSGLSTEEQVRFGVWGTVILPTTALLTSSPLYVVQDTDHEDNDRKDVYVRAGGVVDLYISQTTGNKGTKVYAENGSYKATTTAGTGKRLIGTTIEAVNTTAGETTKCLFFGCLPAATIGA